MLLYIDLHADAHRFGATKHCSADEVCHVNVEKRPFRLWLSWGHAVSKDAQAWYTSGCSWRHRHTLYLCSGHGLLKLTDDAVLLLNLLFEQALTPAALLQVCDFLQQHELDCATCTCVVLSDMRHELAAWVSSGTMVRLPTGPLEARQTVPSAVAHGWS